MTALTCEAVTRAALGEPFRREGAEILYRCPRPERHSNGDAHPSLKINTKKNVWSCFPCNAKGTAWALAAFLARLDPGDKAEVTAWLKERGLLNGARHSSKRDADRKPVATYTYTNADGNPLARKLRFEPGRHGQKKDFAWQRWETDGWVDGLAALKIPLYRCREIQNEQTIAYVEGEKAADAGAKLGLATTTAGGVNSFRLDHAEALRGKDVVIFPDNDPPGREHAHKVAAALHGVAKSTRIAVLPGLPEKGDLYDFIESSGTRDALLERIRNTAEWKPAEEAPALQAGAVLRCFSDIAPKPLRWLWPGRIPLGKLTLLIGDPGLGKSLLTADIASRITRGTPFPDSARCESGSVIFLSAEDDPADTIRPRLDAAGADVSCVHTLEAVRVQLTNGSLTEKPFNLETDVAALEGAVREHPGVRLIVIDPISAYLGGVDSHSNAEVRGVLARLATLAAQYNVAVLCVTHLRKSAGAAVYRAVASIAFTAAARAVWAVAPDPEDADRRLLLAVKQNLSADPGGLAFRIEMAHNNVARLAWEAGAVTLADPTQECCRLAAFLLHADAASVGSDRVPLFPKRSTNQSERQAEVQINSRALRPLFGSVRSSLILLGLRVSEMLQRTLRYLVPHTLEFHPCPASRCSFNG
jgi:KaiC/GvpD/RAD55 family RecA-like ATPase